MKMSSHRAAVLRWPLSDKSGCARSLLTNGKHLQVGADSRQLPALGAPSSSARSCHHVFREQWRAELLRSYPEPAKDLLPWAGCIPRMWRPRQRGMLRNC